MVSVPGGYVGQSAGARREIVDAYVGTAAGRKQLLQGWVGTSAGNRQWYWRTNDLVILNASANSDTEVVVDWSPVGPADKFTYDVYRGGVLLGTTRGNVTLIVDSNLTQNTSYTYRIDAIRQSSGLIADTVSTTVTTKVTPPPPPPTETYFDTGGMVAISSMTYESSGVPRTGTGATADAERKRLYCGQISGYHTNQRSTWNFSLPWYWSKIIRVDSVWFKVRMDHTYASGGTDIGVALHHNDSQKSGCSGTFQYFKTACNTNSQPDAWLGNVDPTSWKRPDADGWLEISNYGVPGIPWAPNTTVRDQVIGGQMKGLALHASDGTANAHYGYGYGVGTTSNAYFLPQLLVRGYYKNG